MSTQPSTMDYLLDQLRDLQATKAVRMFGEYALYCGDKVVGLVCDDQLFLKITAPGKELLGSLYEEGFAYSGAKASMLIPDDFIEDSERLCELVQITANALPLPKPKQRKANKINHKVP